MTMTPAEVIAEMRDPVLCSVDREGRWADAIEAAMREPVALMKDGIDKDGAIVSTKLYAFPPDAVAEIEQLTMERDEARKLVSELSNEGGAEIKRLRKELKMASDDLLDSAESIRKYPFELPELAQRMRLQASRVARAALATETAP